MQFSWIVLSYIPHFGVVAIGFFCSHCVVICIHLQFSKSVGVYANRSYHCLDVQRSMVKPAWPGSQLLQAMAG